MKIDLDRFVSLCLRAIFAITSYMIGIFVFSSIIGKDLFVERISLSSVLFRSGQVGNVIANRNASRLEFERLLVR